MACFEGRTVSFMECKPIAFYKGFPSIKGGDVQPHYHEFTLPLAHTVAYGCYNIITSLKDFLGKNGTSSKKIHDIET